MTDTRRSFDEQLDEIRRESLHLDPPPRLRSLIGQMGEQAATLYRMAMDAYTDGDTALAAPMVER